MNSTLINYSLSVAKSGTGTGRVTSTPSGISCGATCIAIYASGTSVTLTATAAAGSSFSGWSGGGCSGTGSCVVSMNAAQNIYASFNNSPGVLSFTLSSMTAMENVGNFTVTVLRTGGSFGAASVLYSTSASSATSGVDYTSTFGSLSWASGDASSRTISIPIITNTDRNTTARNFTVNLSGANGSTLGSPATVTITIQDDDGGSTPWLDLLLLGN